MFGTLISKAPGCAAGKSKPPHPTNSGRWQAFPGPRLNTEMGSWNRVHRRRQKPYGKFDSGRYACHSVRHIVSNALCHTGSQYFEEFGVIQSSGILSRMISLANIKSIFGNLVQ